MRHTEIVNESNSDFHPWWSQILVSNGDFELIIMAFVGIWYVRIPNKYIINNALGHDEFVGIWYVSIYHALLIWLTQTMPNYSVN